MVGVWLLRVIHYCDAVEAHELLRHNKAHCQKPRRVANLESDIL